MERNTTFVALADGCPQLRETYAFHCNRVTDAGILALASSCPQRLWELGLAHTRTTDVGLEAAAKSPPHLTAVFVSSCTRVTDAGALALTKLPKLHMVEADRTQVTDAFVDALARGAAAQVLRTV